MGNKDLNLWLEREGWNRRAYCGDPSDTVQEVKEYILSKTYYGHAKKKWLTREERNKIELKINGQLAEEGRQLADFQVKKDDIMTYTFTADLMGQ